MEMNIDNWKTQVRKGYLELCLLLIIRRYGRIYGFDLLEKLRQADLPVKEGTLYPLLNRMTEDGTLGAVWETANVKGHPRKFYSLTEDGFKLLETMRHEFNAMIELYQNLENPVEVSRDDSKPAD